VEATASGMGGQGHLLMLGAILVLSLLLAPLAASAALRISVE
jgi:heme exporter protein B